MARQTVNRCPAGSRRPSTSASRFKLRELVPFSPLSQARRFASPRCAGGPAPPGSLAAAHKLAESIPRHLRITVFRNASKAATGAQSPQSPLVRRLLSGLMALPAQPASLGGRGRRQLRRHFS
jgi:hypothetical protein